MIQINLENFKLITGIEFDHFFNHILKGDRWGNFLKVVSVLESTSKRAIALKTKIDPNSEAIGRIEFYNALQLCRELKLITEEAFAFANYLRQVRNDLVHKGFSLDLDIEKMKGTTFYKKYKDRIGQFVAIEGHDISNNDKEHFNTLIMGVCVFVSLINKELYGEDWLENAKKGLKKS